MRLPRVPFVVALALVLGCGPAPRRSVDRPELGWTSEGAAPAEAAAPVTSAAPPAPSVQPRPLEACADSGDGFEGWLESFRRHAVAQGISARNVSRALDGLAYDPEVIALDRSQAAFKLSFAELSAKRITRARLVRGKELLRAHADLLARIEERHGVAPQVLVAIWGLETDYGENIGSRSSLRALATLAYDCRRRERFRAELLSALRIVERGDLTPGEMIGAWAGELGQTQFLPSSYERFAIDFDGDGRIDLVRSSADALGSTASYLQAHGWRAREAWREGTANFDALRSWNASEVYRRVIVAFAAKLPAPAPR